MRAGCRAWIPRLVVLALAGWLAGCASGAAPDAMVPIQSAGFDAASPLRNAVAVTQVTGGSETHPLWVSRVGTGDFEAALLTALRNEGLLAPDPARAPFRLQVDLTSVDQPFLGLSPSVTSSVRYLMTRAPGGQTASDETVTVTDSASFGDAVLGVDRVRIASERSIRSNITEYLARLRRLAASGPPTG